MWCDKMRRWVEQSSRWDRRLHLRVYQRVPQPGLVFLTQNLSLDTAAGEGLVDAWHVHLQASLSECFSLQYGRRLCWHHVPIRYSTTGGVKNEPQSTELDGYPQLHPRFLSSGGQHICGYSLAPGVSWCHVGPATKHLDRRSHHQERTPRPEWQSMKNTLFLLLSSSLQAIQRVKTHSWELSMQYAAGKGPEKTRNKGTGLNSRSHKGPWVLTDHGKREVKVTSPGPPVLKKYWPFLIVQKEDWNKDRSWRQECILKEGRGRRNPSMFAWLGCGLQFWRLFRCFS